MGIEQPVLNLYIVNYADLRYHQTNINKIIKADKIQ